MGSSHYLLERYGGVSLCPFSKDNCKYSKREKYVTSADSCKEPSHRKPPFDMWLFIINWKMLCFFKPQGKKNKIVTGYHRAQFQPKIK